MLKSNFEWESLARRDPLFAIASVKGKRKNESTWTADEFFEKGEIYMEVRRHGLSKIPANSIVLDIGCGAGRITRALAKRFAYVIGVDVAPSMIDLTNTMCADITNAEFLLGDGVTLPMRDKGADAIVSIQVLQHVDRSAIPGILKDCRRVVRSGGIAVLHIPAPSLSHSVNYWLRLASLRRAITRMAARIAPNLDVSGRGWVANQYHTYRIQSLVTQFKAAGFSNIDIFEFRKGQPLSTVYVAS